MIHIAIAIFFAYRAQYYDAYYWAAGLVVIISLPYAHAVASNKFIFYEPTYLFLGSIALTTVPVMILPLNEINYDPGGWVAAMQYFLMGSTVFLIGYGCGLGKKIAARMPINNFILEGKTLSNISGKLYLLGWTTRIILWFPFMGEFRGWQLLDTIGTSSILIALMIDAYFIFSRIEPTGKKTQRFICFISFLGVEVIKNFLSGLTKSVITPIFLIGMVYIKVKKRIPMVYGIILFIIIIMILNPMIKSFRTYYWRGADFQTSYKYSIESISKKSSAERQISTIKRLANPLEMAIYCYNLRSKGQQISLHADLLGFIIQFIPRFIWPNKPGVSYNLIGKELGLLDQWDKTTSVMITLFADLIMNGGILGVIIGLFLIGVLTSIYWQWLIIRTDENILAFIIYLLLMFSWMGENELSVVIRGNIGFILYVLLLIKITKSIDAGGQHR